MTCAVFAWGICGAVILYVPMSATYCEQAPCSRQLPANLPRRYRRKMLSSFAIVCSGCTTKMHCPSSSFSTLVPPGLSWNGVFATGRLLSRSLLLNTGPSPIPRTAKLFSTPSDCAFAGDALLSPQLSAGS